MEIRPLRPDARGVLEQTILPNQEHPHDGPKHLALDALRLSHALRRSVACKWRATMFSFYPKCISCGCTVVAVANIHTHQHNTCVTYTVFIWSFSTFSELYVVCIAYSMRCTKPSILFAIENVHSLSRSLLLRVWAFASFERIISCKIRRCHFVFVFMHTAYNHTPTPTHSHIRARTPFSLRDKKDFLCLSLPLSPFLCRFDFDEFLINFETVTYRTEN